MTSANNIYFDLIKKIKAKVKSQERVVYDPETGVQKTFLQGKLIFTKKFIPSVLRIKHEDKGS